MFPMGSMAIIIIIILITTTGICSVEHRSPPRNHHDIIAPGLEGDNWLLWVESDDTPQDPLWRYSRKHEVGGARGGHPSIIMIPRQTFFGGVMQIYGKLLPFVLCHAYCHGLFWLVGMKTESVLTWTITSLRTKFCANPWKSSIHKHNIIGRG